MTPLRIVFMGTPDFAVPCLQALLDRPDLANVIAVYTQPDRPAGRGMDLREPPVKTLAVARGVPVFQPESINKGDEPRRLADLMCDVAVVVAYAQFLGKAVLNTPRMGCLNVHSSLLPKYRGAAPIQYAILNGETETGVTTMKLVTKMDAGPILLQSRMAIPPTMTSAELFVKLSKLGAQTLVQTLEGLRAGTITEVTQDDAQATYAHIIKKEDGRVNWADSTTALLNRLRAFTPWPGLHAMTNRGVLKIHEAAPATTAPTGADAWAKPGDTHVENHRSSVKFCVKCGDGWLDLRMVQLEGKKPMTAEQFVNGLKSNKEDFRFI